MNQNYGYTLTSLVEYSARLQQVCRGDVYEGDRLYIITANSVYHILAAEDGWFYVSGGWFDRKGVAPLKTRIAGCTWGGSVLKRDIVAACGLCIEFSNRVVTSPVRKVILLARGKVN